MNVFLLSNSCVDLMEVHAWQVLHEVLVDYNLTDKIRNVFNFCIIFYTKYLFPCFV